MHKMKTLAYKLVCALMVVTSTASPVSSQPELLHMSGIVRFSSQDTRAGKPLVFRGTDGRRYKLLLVPDIDARGHIVVLDLVLQKIGSASSEVNLLEPAGAWHGAQPFSFAASDFAPAATRVPLDKTRTIDVPTLKMKLRISVKAVDLGDISQQTTASLPLEFKSLVLEVVSM